MEDSDISIDQLLTRISELEAKIDQLYMRPRMPHTQNASDGEVCTLDINKIPVWAMQ